ncbi:glycosyltransferase family protein [Vibrio methylphosphonaticus]|uniref:glycosyltransferase family 1 protein n=1 Tax=Vibrio methylphosphonaticus TaxID=2946866 RepID=UPI00202A9ACC|nr:glycosyltransferase family 1 protein [Vibrio methylphosphonaticus]MCL9774403.1 glycosyltransferase family 1 protein [Vibrio methylphosphonaticus]
MRDLIVFGEDFGALPSSTQHLVKRLAKQRKVLWVNSIGLRQPRLSRHDVNRALNKLLGKDKSHQLDMDTETVPSSMTIVNLITIPAPRSTVMRKLAAKLMAYQLLPIIKSLSLENALVWTSLPTAIDVCPLLGDYPVVYYCGDDFGALAGVDHRTVLEHEEKLVANASLIITASDKLLGKFPVSKTKVLSHGVDCGTFSTPTTRASDLPDNNRPIAGFYGSLSDWLDYPLLNDAIRALPHWDFVFIGQLELDNFPIVNADNVYYLGPRPHSTLPSYSQHWTVSLLPFVLNEQIIACNPLKLKEYLAAQRPIVTSHFPALEPYREHVNIVNDSASLIETLTRLELHSAELPKGLVDSESWDQRVTTLERYLEAI